MYLSSDLLFMTPCVHLILSPARLSLGAESDILSFPHCRTGNPGCDINEISKTFDQAYQKQEKAPSIRKDGIKPQHCKGLPVDADRKSKLFCKNGKTHSNQGGFQ